MALRGAGSSKASELPRRLAEIGAWIARVADQPTSVWWAAHQTGLHPYIRFRILWELKRSTNNVSSAVRRAWQYLFEAWEEKQEDFQFDPYDLHSMIIRDGWSRAAVRKFVQDKRPVLKVEHSRRRRPKPPERKDNIRLEDMLDFEVEYPPQQFDLEIPDEWLKPIVQGLRQNLERAVELETEVGGYTLSKIAPIIPEHLPHGGYFGRTFGLSASIITFSEAFERLTRLNVQAARHELAVWPTDDDTIFGRLRIWACGIPELVSEEVCRLIITSLSDKCFWHRSHQRDLLLVLAKRWADLSSSARREIELRLLDGPAKWKDEPDNEFEERKARSSLDRVTWLENNGCEFSAGLAGGLEKLRERVTGWKTEYASHAADSMEVRGGTVRKDTEHSALLNEPVGSILSKAIELSGRREDFLVEKDPFAGLSAKRPARAFAALTHEAKRKEYPDWAWRTFLGSDARSKDKSKFSALIAERLSRYEDVAVAMIIDPIADWILSSTEKLARDFPESFDKVTAKLVTVLHSQAPGSSSPIRLGSKEHDWTLEARYNPVGKIALALLRDPRLNGLKVGEGFRPEWLTFVDGLLSLSGNLRRWAIVIFAHNLNWFYDVDTAWTERRLLCVLDGEDEDDQNAFWSGFFRAAVPPRQELYARIKPSLLATATNRPLSRDNHGEVLGGIILAGWASKSDETQERFISNGEMRNVLLCGDDDFRSFILWQVERWSQSSDCRTAETWSGLLSEFLRDVWPRQISAKTPKISACLCDLAFSNVQLFPKIADIVLPLLSKIDRTHGMHSGRASRDNIAHLYPHQALALLDAVLPDEIADWPFGIEEIIQHIGEAATELKRDARWLELSRKWNAR